MHKIEWTDMTLNPVIGCSHAGYRAQDGSKRGHPGCDNCYAEVMCSRALPGFEAHNACSSGGRWTGKIEVLHERILWPFTRKEYARRRDDKQRRVFLTSLSDMGHPLLPERDWMAIQGMMILAHWIDWQDLTKRPDRQRVLLEKHRPVDCVEALLEVEGASDLPYPTMCLEDVRWIAELGLSSWANYDHIHRYVSVSDQATADALIPELLRMPAAVRGVSAEPLLGPVDLWQAVFGLTREQCEASRGGVFGVAEGLEAGPHHVIVGGESGRNARLCDMAWIESLINQCRVAEIPVFVKQLGARSVWLPGKGGFVDLGSKGQDWAAWPSELRARMHVGDVWRSSVKEGQA